jgi:hypothetical protein
MQRKWDELDILQSETSDPEQNLTKKKSRMSVPITGTNLPSLENIAAIIE